jgi:hypothetical protein
MAGGIFQMKFNRNALLISISALGMAALASCVTITSTSEETYYVTEYVTENRTEQYSEVVPVNVVASGEDILTPYINWGSPALVFQGLQNVSYFGYDLSDLPTHDTEKIKIAFGKQQYYEYTIVRVYDMSARGQVLGPPIIAPGDGFPPPGIKREILTMQGETSTFNNWLDMANWKLNYALLLGGKTDIWLNYDGPYTLEISRHGKNNIAVIISGASEPQNMRSNVFRSWVDSSTQYVTRSGERPVPYQLEKKTARQRAVLTSRQAPFWELFLPK